MSQASTAADAGARTTVRWRIFAVVFIVVVINLIDRTTISIAMPTIAHEFNLTNTMRGLILSAFFWSYAVLQIPGGWLIDRFGPRKLIAGSTVLWGFFQAIAAVATGGISLLVSRIGLGVAEAPMFPAGAKLSALWLSPDERGRGAVIMDSGAPLGAAFGGVIIASLIISFGSWRPAFAAVGVATMLLGWIAWAYLRDDPAIHPGVNPAERAHIAGEGASKAAAPYQAPDRLHPVSVSGLLIGRMAWAMINFGLLTWGPSYLAKARSMNLAQMGYATFVIFLAGMAGSLFSGFFADALLRRGCGRAAVYKVMLTISGLATMASFLVLPDVQSPEAAVATLSITLFFLYWGSLYWSLPTLLAPREKVGFLGGIMNFAGSVSGIAVPIITGVVLDMTGTYEMVLYFFAACAAVYVLGTLFIQLPKAAR